MKLLQMIRDKFAAWQRHRAHMRYLNKHFPGDMQRARSMRFVNLPHHVNPQSGFTMIELMIVVAIVGILTGLSVAAYSKFSVRAQVAEGIRAADSIEASAGDAFNAVGQIPSTNVEAGLSATQMQGRYFTNASVYGNGVVAVTFGASANPAITGKVLTWTPYTTTDGTSLAWVCGLAQANTAGGWTALTGDGTGTTAPTTTVANEYLPANCRSGATS